MRAKATVHSMIAILALIVFPIVARANEPPTDFFLISVIGFHATGSAGATLGTTPSFVYTGEFGSSIFSEAFVAARTLGPGERGVIEINAASAKAGPGAIFGAQGSPEELHVQSYVYNDAKPEVGVAVPGVRLLRDLGGNLTIRLLGIPISASSRTLVRIYAMPRSGPGDTDPDVLVHVFDSIGNPLATDMVHLVSPPIVSIETSADQPAYAEYRPVVDPTKYSSISIDLEALPSAGRAIWAFSTTTSATSDSVTAVFPAK